MKCSYAKFEALINARGLKVADVCKETEIDQSIFTCWKQGKSFPKVDKLYKIAKMFDVAVEYFLVSEGE